MKSSPTSQELEKWQHTPLSGGADYLQLEDEIHYHNTNRKNLLLILQNGLRKGSFLSTIEVVDPDWPYVVALIPRGFPVTEGNEEEDIMIRARLPARFLKEGTG